MRIDTFNDAILLNHWMLSEFFELELRTALEKVAEMDQFYLLGAATGIGNIYANGKTEKAVEILLDVADAVYATVLRILASASVPAAEISVDKFIKSAEIDVGLLEEEIRRGGLKLRVTPEMILANVLARLAVNAFEAGRDARFDVFF